MREKVVVVEEEDEVEWWWWCRSSGGGCRKGEYSRWRSSALAGVARQCEEKRETMQRREKRCGYCRRFTGFLTSSIDSSGAANGK